MTPLDLAGLARKKVEQLQGVESYEKEQLRWTEILERGRASISVQDLSDPNFEKFALACSTVDQFACLIRLIYQTTKNQPNSIDLAFYFTGLVERSPYSLAEWMSAIEFFSGWLTEQQRPLDLLHMLHYLECCTFSLEAPGSASLLQLTSLMLGTYGYDG